MGAVSAEARQLSEVMGVSEGQAEKMLRAAGGDVNRAIDICLTQVPPMEG